jgi:glycosyltransferase involved in cell wall biosynthesis
MPALLLVFIYGLRYIGKSNIVFAHSPGLVYGFPALLLAKAFGKPILIDLTDTRDQDTPGFIYRYVLRNSSIVFSVSSYLAEAARRAGCRNVVHAPGFINTDAFKYNAAARTKIRKELNIGNDDIVIGYAGAFSPDEGLNYLLRAFKRLTVQFDNIRLVFLGGRNVSGYDEIPQLIKELGLEKSVTVIPPQPYELVPDYLSAFDIACSPKVDRKLNRAADPIRVYEYMAVGLPAVASAVGETANALENGQDGFLVKPEDEADLTKALEHIIRNLDSLGDLRKRAREKVIESYSQQTIQKKLETHLPRLVRK